MTRRARERRAGAAGFTLIEVMVALAILGAAVFVLLEAQSGSLRLQLEADEELTLSYLAARALSQAEVDVLAGNLSGSNDFGKRFDGYAYSYTATASNEALPGYYALEVTLQGPTESRVIDTLIYDARK